MFTNPAVDLVGLVGILRQTGTFGRYRSRVRGLPEFSGELPLACLAEEIDTPGPGQIRALVTLAGNPVLSGPNARRLETAMASLEFMVAIDFYLNETTRHADVLLPGTFALEHDHYDLLFNALAVRNVARYSAPVLRPPASGREDWQILLELATGIARRASGLRARFHGMEAAFLRWYTPRRVIALALRFGPYGAGLHPLRKGLSLQELERSGRTIDLGPLQPGRLRRRLFTKGKRIGEVFLKIDADQTRTDLEVQALAMAPIPTPEVLWRKPPVLALAALPGTALGRLGEPSTASPAAWAAAGAAVRMLHDAHLPPWPGRSLDEVASQLHVECEWLVTNGVLAADLVARNRRIAEAALRPWTPVFTHGDLQISHVFVDGEEITGVIDWSRQDRVMPCMTSRP